MKIQKRDVLQAAFDLLDEVGIDGLSTRRLAAKLGVQQPALYWHVASKQALLDEMANAMMTEMNQTLNFTPPRDWRLWLAGVGKALRSALLAHRDGARVHAGSRPDAAQLPFIEAKMQVLCEAGLSARDALLALSVLSRYTLGWVLEEQADSLSNTKEKDEGFFKSIAQDFPLLAKGVKAQRRLSQDTQFEAGLSVVIAGLGQKS